MDTIRPLAEKPQHLVDLAPAPHTPAHAPVVAADTLQGTPSGAAPATIGGPSTQVALASPGVSRGLLKQIASEAAQHPLTRFASARAQERQIGLLAPQNPKAQAAASALLGLVHSFLKQQQAMTPEQITTAFTKQSFSRTGSVQPEDVNTVLKHGNLREQLALVDIAAEKLSGALLEIGQKAAQSPEYRKFLENTSSLRVDTIVKKYYLAAALGGKRGYGSLVLNPSSPLQRLPKMRTERSFMVFNRATGNIENRPVRHMKFLHQTGSKGIDFDEHSQLPLSNREEKNLLAGYVNGLPPEERNARATELGDFKNVMHARLSSTEGRHGKRPKLDEPWIAQAVDRGLPVSAGISGHTYLFMSLFHDLGGDKEQFVDLRLACLAFLVPAHHSYHEVMGSAAEYDECRYDPAEHTADKLVAQLRAEAGKSTAVRASARAAAAQTPGKIIKPSVS